MKTLVWILWTAFLIFIIYACIAISQLWFIAFLLWFIPAHYITVWIENGIIKEINKERKL